jgi:hypothetical protein
MSKKDTCCTLALYFEVASEHLQAFKALGVRLATKARSEAGCIRYAFSFKGNTAHCREDYMNAEAVLAHMQNVGELLGEVLQISKITRLEVHATAAELEKLKGPMGALNPEIFVLE